MAWHERPGSRRLGYRKQRWMVKSTETSFGIGQVQYYPSEKLCLTCKQPIGFDRLFVKHYRWHHLDCWQAAFPDLAAQDTETREKIVSPKDATHPCL